MQKSTKIRLLAAGVSLIALSMILRFYVEATSTEIVVKLEPVVLEEVPRTSSIVWEEEFLPELAIVEVAEVVEEVEEVEEVIVIEDFELICRLVAAEARGECYEGKKAVAQVVKDRMEHSDTWFGGPTARGVIYKKGQFAKPWQGNLDTYPDIAEAVEAVFAKGERVFEDVAIYFYYPKYSTTAGAAPIKRYNYLGQVGVHRFHGDRKLK